MLAIRKYWACCSMQHKIPDKGMKACVVGLYVSLYCATLEHSLLCIKNWYTVKRVPHSGLTHLLLTTHSGWVREKAVSSHLIFEERSALFTWCEDHWRMTPSEDTSIVKQCITVLRPDTLCFLTGFPVSEAGFEPAMLANPGLDPPSKFLSKWLRWQVCHVT